MTSRSLTVRRATTDDSASIAGLINAAFAEYRPWLVPPSGALEETIATIAAQLAGVYGAAIAERDGEPCACVLFRPEGPACSFDPKEPTSTSGGSRCCQRISWLGRRRRDGGLRRRRSARPWLPRRSPRSAHRITRNQRLFARLGYVEIARHAHPGFDSPTWIEIRVAGTLDRLPASKNTLR